jgi:hyperosmotically inducible periplasmic protein
MADPRSLWGFIVAQLELAMKAVKTFKLIGSALIVVVSINAWSQTSESAATSTQSSMAPAEGGSAKAARQANRALSKKVIRALSKGGVKTSGINVIAKGGAVALAGSVTDPAQIDKAGEVAKGVSGVTSVKNALTVKEVGQ